MSQLGVTKIGITGPSGRIGSGTEYHIDTKFGRNLSFEQIRDRLDALATKYQADGREIEFSNDAVSGEIYDLNKTPEERLELVRRAASAHSHSVSPEFHSFDYYAPLAGKGRYHKSAEGAPIYVVGAEGLKVEGGTGGGYGNHAFVIGKDGKVISKTGHGDNSQAVYAGGVIPIGAKPGANVLAAPLTDQEGNQAPKSVIDAKERAKTYSEMSKQELNAEYDRLRTDSPETAAEEGLRMHQAFFKK